MLSPASGSPVRAGDEAGKGEGVQPGGVRVGMVMAISGGKGLDQAAGGAISESWSGRSQVVA